MKLQFSSRAEREIASNLDYLYLRSPKAASGLSRRIEAVLNKLRDYPRSGRATSHTGIRVTNTSPYPYLIFYEVTPSTVDVVASVHAARDPIMMPAQPR